MIATTDDTTDIDRDNRQTDDLKSLVLNNKLTIFQKKTFIVSFKNFNNFLSERLTV